MPRNAQFHCGCVSRLVNNHPEWDQGRFFPWLHFSGSCVTDICQHSLAQWIDSVMLLLAFLHQYFLMIDVSVIQICDTPKIRKESFKPRAHKNIQFLMFGGDWATDGRLGDGLRDPREKVVYFTFKWRADLYIFFRSASEYVGMCVKEPFNFRYVILWLMLVTSKHGPSHSHPSKTPIRNTYPPTILPPQLQKHNWTEQQHLPKSTPMQICEGRRWDQSGVS